MPPQKGKSSIAEKLKKKGADKILKKHANDELKYDTGGSLPEFENGVAQLTAIKWGTYEKGDNKGKDYFLAQAVILEPEKGKQGEPLKGKQTKMGPICLDDEPGRGGRQGRTFEENLARVQAILRKLGADSDSVADPEGFEAAAEALVEAGVCFSCRAWKGSKQEIEKKGGKFFVGDKSYATEEAAKKANPYVGMEPRVNEVWDKAMPEYSPASGGDDVEDNSGKEEPEEESAEEEATEETTEEEASSEGEDDGLDALAEKANGDDQKAQKEIVKRAKAAGMSQDDIDGKDNWTEVIEAIREASAGTEEEATEEEAEEVIEEEEEEKEFVPVKGSVYKYKPVDPKTKKAGKAIEVDVTSVDKKAKKVDAKNLDSGKVLKGIPWDKLIVD